MKKFLANINVFQQCRDLNVAPFSCPRFLFVLMGFIIIIAILATYFVGQYFVTPDMVITLVTILTMVLMIIMHVVVQAFEQVVIARRAELAHAKEVLLLRDQFVYVAIHDLRSGGTAIKWGLKLLEGSTGGTQGETSEVVKQMRKKNEDLLKLAHNILLVTRIDGETLPIAPREVPIQSVVTDAIADQREAITEKNVRVVVDLPENLPILFVDPSHTREMFGILIGNAVAHSDPSSPLVSVTGTRLGKEVIIAIENNGPAIPPENLEHVFEQYWRSSGPDRSEGTGLPLYIAHELARLMGGRMWFSSALDSTNFTVALPRV